MSEGQMTTALGIRLLLRFFLFAYVLLVLRLGPFVERDPVRGHANPALVLALADIDRVDRMNLPD